MQNYTGSCHCGKVKYEAKADIEKVLSCNCSYCIRTGSLLSFIPASQFTLLSGEDNLTEYRFNKKVIEHLFCKDCGIESFSRGVDQAGNAMVALNVRCIEGFDTERFTVEHYNGRDF